MNIIFETLLRSFFTVLFAVPLGLVAYHLIYYRFTRRKEIKELILDYLEFVNMDYDTSIRGRTRTMLDENNNIIEVENEPVYPSTKAIMKRVHCNPVIITRAKFGVKYDEAFFDSIMGELLMEGRVSPIHDKKTDEIIAFKFENFKM